MFQFSRLQYDNKNLNNSIIFAVISTTFLFILKSIHVSVCCSQVFIHCTQAHEIRAITTTPFFPLQICEQKNILFH